MHSKLSLAQKGDTYQMKHVNNEKKTLTFNVVTLGEQILSLFRQFIGVLILKMLLFSISKTIFFSIILTNIQNAKETLSFCRAFTT